MCHGGGRRARSGPRRGTYPETYTVQSGAHTDHLDSRGQGHAPHLCALAARVRQVGSVSVTATTVFDDGTGSRVNLTIALASADRDETSLTGCAARAGARAGRPAGAARRGG